MKSLHCFYSGGLEETLFLCSQKPAGWTGPQGSLCPGLWSLFTLGFPEAPAEKEGGEFLCVLFLKTQKLLLGLLHIIHLSGV